MLPTTIVMFEVGKQRTRRSSLPMVILLPYCPAGPGACVLRIFSTSTAVL